MIENSNLYNSFGISINWEILAIYFLVPFPPQAASTICDRKYDGKLPLCSTNRQTRKPRNPKTPTPGLEWETGSLGAGRTLLEQPTHAAAFLLLSISETSVGPGSVVGHLEFSLQFKQLSLKPARH